VIAFLSPSKKRGERFTLSRPVGLRAKDDRDAAGCDRGAGKRRRRDASKLDGGEMFNSGDGHERALLRTATFGRVFPGSVPSHTRSGGI